MTSAPPPGLEGNLAEYVRGGEGDWLPVDQKRFYTNAFVIHDDKVSTIIIPYIRPGNDFCFLRSSSAGRNVDLASTSKSNFQSLRVD